jgi:hypothetical protein
MKHLLILIVAASLYLHFYPNEEVTQFYNKYKQTLLSGFNKFSDTKVRLKPEKIYTDLAKDLDSFSENEVEHLKAITSSREMVNKFYQQICKTQERDFIFHITNEKKVCSTIDIYSSML